MSNPALARTLQVSGALLLTIAAWGFGWEVWALCFSGAFLLAVGFCGQGFEEGKEEGVNYMLWLEGVDRKLKELNDEGSSGKTRRDIRHPSTEG